MEDIISALEQDGTEWALQQIEVPKWRTGYIFTSYPISLFVQSHKVFAQWDMTRCICMQ